MLGSRFRNTMIVSHRHRFIFFAIPKTGTHSLREALRPHLGEDDWEQCNLFVQRRSPIEPLARFRHGHLGVTDVKPHLPEEVWRDYFKFAIVRNPWDRFISLAFFRRSRSRRFLREPEGPLKRLAGRPRLTERLLGRPQHWFVSDGSGQPVVDYVGRFESLQTSFDEICDRIGLPRTELSVTNNSPHEPYRTYYDDDLRSIVAERYAEDARMFGYSFAA